MKSQHHAYLLALGAVLAWSTVSTAFKLSLRGLTPLGLLLISALSSTMFLIAVLRVKQKGNMFRHFSQNLKASLLPGLLNPFLYYLMLFFAYERLPAQEAQVLNYTWAIILALASAIVLKQQLKVRDGLALLLSFVGVVIISTRGNILSMQFADPLGSFVAVATSLVWACYWILNMRDGRSGLMKMTFSFLIGSFIILLWFLIIDKSRVSALLKPDAKLVPAILAAVYVGLFEMGFTFLIWMAALSKADKTASVSNLVFITPFLSLILIRFILKESIHVATIGGLLLIVGSNIMQKWEQMFTRTKRE